MEEVTRVECATCGWFNESRDSAWTKNAGRVHVDVLKRGHVLGVYIKPERCPDCGLYDCIKFGVRTCGIIGQSLD